jgi:hypothetical protein
LGPAESAIESEEALWPDQGTGGSLLKVNLMIEIGKRPGKSGGCAAVVPRIKSNKYVKIKL